MCRLCGREACAECFEQVKDLTVDRPGAGQAEIVALQARREKHAHSNPFFLSCTRRNEHQAKDFSPMSRFCREELAQAIADMERLLEKEDGNLNGATQQEMNAQVGSEDGHINGTSVLPSPADVSDPTTSNNSTTDSTGLRTPPDSALPLADPSKSVVASDNTNGHSQLPPPYIPPSGAATNIPCHTIRRFSDTELTDDVFRPIWAHGEPLLVTNVLHKFKIKWTPEYFMEKYNSQSCLIIECQTDVNKRVTVGEFFGWFGMYEGRTECWKLKVRPRCLVRVSLAPNRHLRAGLATINRFQDGIPRAV